MHNLLTRAVGTAIVVALLAISTTASTQAAGEAPLAPVMDCAALKQADYAAYRAQCVKHDPIVPDSKSLASPGGPEVQQLCLDYFLPIDAPKWTEALVACVGPCC